MAIRVEWSPNALDDIEQIAEFITRDSNYYARSVVGQIVERTSLLKKFPKQGRIVPELNNEMIREIFVYQYRIIYEISDSKTVLILVVIHGSRDF